MKEPLMLTIDFGTQSVRACLFNKKGETVAIKKVPYNPPYKSPKPGYAEQDPYYFIDVLSEATKPLVNENKDLMDDVLGITMSFFRDSPVILDKDNKPIRDAIIWLDERRAKADKPLPVLHNVLFNLIGMKPTIDLNRQRSMSHWIIENEPENWSRLDKYMNLSTFVTMQLIGKYVDSPASQAGHVPFDFKNGKWLRQGALKDVYDIPVNTLCKLIPVGQVMGTITKEASEKTGLPEGMKMFACGSDKAAETLGLGALRSDVAAVSYGTASTIEVTSKRYSDAEPFLPSYPSVVLGYYNMEVQVYRGYWMLNWFAKEFGESERVEAEIEKKDVLQILDEGLAKIPPGSDGLILQPYWGAGLRRPLAKGAVVGFSDCHTRSHLYRAIIEGIAFALREGMEFFEKKRTHKKVKSIRIAGGGSQSDAICQITADIFGLPVSRIQTNECSSLGCAIAGFVATKEFKDAGEAIKAMVHQKDEFIPNEENHKKYNYLFNNVYMKLYPRLQNLYKELKNYQKEFDD